jgi:hypothetical protein
MILYKTTVEIYQKRQNTNPRKIKIINRKKEEIYCPI